MQGTVTGNVGIFWVDRGQLIMAAAPVADGINDGRFVNGPYDHDPYSETVQRAHPHLLGAEYYRAPRRRVLFNKAEHHFYSYVDTILYTNTIKRMILEHVHLPRKHTIFRTDLHYITTDPDEIDPLFSQ